MTWNKKNQQFALSCGLRPSAQEVAKCLNRMLDKFKPVEKIIDLREINKFIGKHRVKGEYDRKTIKEAIAQLNEKTFGWFVVLKSYTWAVHKILIRPVDFALANKSQSLGEAPKPKHGNPMFSDEHKKASRELLLQNISKLDSFLKKLGMNYSYDSLVRLWRTAGKQMSDIEDAVKYMLKCHAKKIKQQSDLPLEDRKGVETPKGWLHECLKYGWHLLDEEIELPVFESGKHIVSFVDRLRMQT